MRVKIKKILAEVEEVHDTNDLLKEANKVQDTQPLINSQKAILRKFVKKGLPFNYKKNYEAFWFDFMNKFPNSEAVDLFMQDPEYPKLCDNFGKKYGFDLDSFFKEIEKG